MKSNTNRQKKIIYRLIVIWFSIIFFGIYFIRDFRSLFSAPVVDQTKTIGYAHYFGYPIHFDTLAFNFFLLLPLIIIFFAKLYLSLKNRKNA